MPNACSSSQRLDFIPSATSRAFVPASPIILPALLEPPIYSICREVCAETDPTFKQLIPYIVLRWRERVFCYMRGKASGEVRLHALRSLGIGGHICAEDERILRRSVSNGNMRELEEEVFLDTSYSERIIGLINDDHTPVGQVHLGIVHVLDLAEPNVRHRDEALAGGEFASLRELCQSRDEFETWSQFLLEGDWLGS